MDSFRIALILATLLCSLVAGLVFAFAIVNMPGIQSLKDRESIRTFQVMDRVIQNNQPVFMLVWLGPTVALVISVVFGVGQLDGIGHLLLMCTVIAYLLGVQLPTATINTPLNNKLQTLDVDIMSETALSEAREDFEPHWNRWNSRRTVCATLTSALLIIVVFRL